VTFRCADKIRTSLVCGRSCPFEFALEREASRASQLIVGTRSHPWSCASLLQNWISLSGTSGNTRIRAAASVGRMEDKYSRSEFRRGTRRHSQPFSRAYAQDSNIRARVRIFCRAHCSVECKRAVSPTLTLVALRGPQLFLLYDRTTPAFGSVVLQYPEVRAPLRIRPVAA